MSARLTARLAAAWLATMLAGAAASATPVVSTDAVLPAGSELNEQLLDQPTELFAFERAGGKRSYLFNLGDMLFSSSVIFGGKARDAGLSCNTATSRARPIRRFTFPACRGGRAPSTPPARYSTRRPTTACSIR